MTVKIEWLDQPWSMAINFTEIITTDDFRAVIMACLPRLKENPIYFLIDMSQVTDIDRKVFELSSLSEWIYHPNGRWFAYVQPHRLFSSIMKMRQRGNYKAFEKREEALAFIESTSRAEPTRVKLF